MRFKFNSIYEINARILVRRLQVTSLLEIPDEYWNGLQSLGFDYVWLMGVWKIPESSIKKYCFEEGLVEEYKKVITNWRERDVAGSPYAIEDYIINPCLGESNEVIKELKKKLNRIGIKLILDFIPNHFNAESSLLKTNPEIFLQGDEYLLEENSITFFRSPYSLGNIFAHGKDPNFDAWQDTVQINYFSNEAKEFMREKLYDLANLCDGVRCDMAMLAINEVFEKTWGSIPIISIKNKEQFWSTAIKDVKRNFPQFVFIAEAYWNLEWELQRQGFDYTYDKRLYDRLLEGNVHSIKTHLNAEESFQQKSLRFIENHDEKRVISLLGEEKSKAAAVIISTVPGMSFYFEGQFSGKKIKLPLQLNREPYESPDESLQTFYEKLLGIVKQFSCGEFEWNMLETFSAWEGNFTNSNFLCWQIKNGDSNYVVCLNYSDYTSQCRIRPKIISEKTDVVLMDLLNGKKYLRNLKEIQENGLYVELSGFGAHIFDIKKGYHSDSLYIKT